MTQMDAVNKVSESFSETKIDFSESTITTVFDELKPSGGHHIDLDIVPNSEAMVIHIKYLAPEGHATMVMTQPFYILKMPKQDLPIAFK